MPLPNKTFEQNFYLRSNKEKTIREIARILSDSVSQRRNFFPDKEVLTISSAEPSFNLVTIFEMFDPNKNPIMDSLDPETGMKSQYYFWFLNENAEKYHKELCYNGYYHGRDR